jgi:hypothetical protein
MIIFVRLKSNDMKTSQNRRDFIRISAASTLGIMALGPTACSPGAATVKKGSGVGLILYTIRDAMDQDTPGSLQKVADLGYQYLELANYSDDIRLPNLKRWQTTWVWWLSAATRRWKQKASRWKTPE